MVTSTLQRERTSLANSTNLLGHVFDRLHVLARVPASGKSRAHRWLCRCECGGTAIVLTSNLRKGNTRSCGCLQRQRSSDASRKSTIGYSGAHMRVRRVRGLASEQGCIDCGNPAAQWSYRHDDQDELTAVRRDSRDRSTNDIRIVRFSADPAHYDPRCIACHNAFDQRNAHFGEVC